MRPFYFKKFKVEQARSPMKVGTDGVLIGAWSRVESDDRALLDIGTGCGLIALMMAQRTADSRAIIDAVEINEQSVLDAEQNFAESSWSERLRLYNSDIQSFVGDVRYDNIVSNPPFFVDSLSCPDRGRYVARHSVELPFEELIDAVDRLLSEDGRLSIILPPTEMEHFTSLAEGRFNISRRCMVYGREGGSLRRVMAEFVRGSCELVQQSLTLESRGVEGERYREEYRELTHDFYLKF